MPRDRDNLLRWKRDEYQKKRDAILAQRKADYGKNPEKYLAANRARKRQGTDGTPPHEGECPICERTAMLYYDHDHGTKRFRGWICTRCNTGLGYFRDDVEALRAAIGYLVASRIEIKRLAKVG